MAFTFENPKRFVRESLGSVAGAFTLASLGTLLFPQPTLHEICAYAFWGTFGGAALRMPQCKGRLRHNLQGAAWGGLASTIAYILSERWGASPEGFWLASGLAGFGLGLWLMLEPEPEAQRSRSTLSRMLGALGGAGSAALGVFGAAEWLAFAASHHLDTPLTYAGTAGLLGLWLVTGTGLRHVTRAAHPLVSRARTLLSRLQPPVAHMLENAIVHFETLSVPPRDGTPADFLPVNAERNTAKLAESLLEAMVQSAGAWQNLHDALTTPELQFVDDKLARLAQARDNSEDSVALAQLTRAAQAVRAQQHALSAMETQKGRALANLEAQLALLERLHVAHLQFRLGDPQRFSMERDAVAEQVERLSDDFDALSNALLEAEAYRDRDALAEVERTGRKALERMREQVQATAVQEEAFESVAQRE